MDSGLPPANGRSANVATIRSSGDPGERDLERRWAIRLLHAGSLLIILFQIAYAVLDYLQHRESLSHAVLALHLWNILLGVGAFICTRNPGQPITQRWIALAFGTGTLIVAGMIGISVATGEVVPLTIALSLWVVGTGTLLPWPPGWQFAFSTVTIAGFALAVKSAHQSDLLNAYGMVGMLSAAGLGQLATMIGRDFRRALSTRMVKLRESEERLRAEIEERECTARKLAESEAMLRTIFDATVDLVMITRFSDGTLIDVNQAIEQYGLNRDTVLGSTVFGLGFWPDRERRAEFLRRLDREGIVRNFEQEMRRPGGTPATLLLSAALAQIGGEKCIVAISRDISRLKENERELIAARETALAASQAKSEFLSGMSHEIRTPMNAILGMSELLAETPLNDQQRRYLSVMQANGNSLIALINDILDLAKVESGRLRLEQAPFDLESLMDTVGETLGVSAQAKGLELVVRLGPEVPRKLIGDPLRLKQILINLVGNAIKFTKRGEIVLNAEREPAADEPARLRFTVADTGIGIAADKIPDLFLSFTQGDSSIARRYGGSGLGLSIVRRLVELMGGRVWVESQPDAGSTFYFTANFGVDPGATAANGSMQASGAAAMLPQLGGMRALVVDDNRVNRIVVREIIAARGVDVAEANSGAQALGEVKSARHGGRPFDLIILDCRMPDMNGFEVVQHLRRAAASDDSVVLMLTSDDLNIQIPRVRELGLDAYIVKPVRRAELLAAIAAALARRNRIAAGSISAIPVAAVHGDAAPPPAVNQAAPAAHSELAVADHPARLLLADDSADNRLLINSYLRRMPYQIDEAENGEVAFKKATAGHYDLILMDLQMPVVDGLQATRMIREWELGNGAPRTPIIALTASVLEEDVRKTLDAGADLHVSKPVTRSMLLGAIREVIARDAEARAEIGEAEASGAEPLRS